MDIGHYERFTGELFSNINSVTSGRIFQSILDKERALGYEGRWISIDSHVPKRIVEWIKNVQETDNADIVIIEIGGTTGEEGHKLFLEANRILKVENPNDVAHVHVSYLPVPNNLGEMKSKPVQLSVKLLNQAGINPDFIVARAGVDIDDIRREKISKYCTVPYDHVISAPDIENIYQVPLNFERDELSQRLLETLGLSATRNGIFEEWKEKYEKITNPTCEVTIGIVGKYYKSGDFDLKDSYVSVEEAINHAAWELGCDPKVKWLVADNFEEDPELLKELDDIDALIVPQGWGSRGSEGKIKAIEYARKNKIPYLGLCYGMQMAVIEFARNVVGLENASSEEVDPEAQHHVIHMMEDQKDKIQNEDYGGTIRLGAWPCKLNQESQTYSLYKKFNNELFDKLPTVHERHRHRYEFNNKYREQLEKAGLVIAGTSPDDRLVEAIELPEDVHPFFVATQYHPELKSQLLKPHPLFMGLIQSALD
jgi:CTP synthase